MFHGPFDESMVKRGIDRGLVRIHLRDIRDSAKDKHRTVDDSPFGGGPGMVMKAQPIFDAIDAAKNDVSGVPAHVVLLSPQGVPFVRSKAIELAARPHLILICGHYEGVDERVIEHAIDEEISVGDFILTGGEIPAMAVTDAVVRLIPGVLGDPESINDTFSSGLLQFPQYTRPRSFRGWEVPEIVLSGNHPALDRWRRLESIRRTKRRRPDLLSDVSISPQEMEDAEAEEQR